MFKSIIKAVFGDPNLKEINRLSPIVEEINDLGPEMEAKSDADL